MEGSGTAGTSYCDNPREKPAVVLPQSSQGSTVTFQLLKTVTLSVLLVPSRQRMPPPLPSGLFQVLPSDQSATAYLFPETISQPNDVTSMFV